MRRCGLTLILLILALMATSCSRRDLLIVTDQYWQAATLENGGVAAGLARQGSERGVSIQTVVVPYTPSNTAKLAAEVRTHPARLILLSPLYSIDAAGLANELPDRHFAAFSTEAQSSGVRANVPNLVYLISDPGPVFTLAGKRLEGYLGRQSNGSEVVRVAAIFSDDSSGTAASVGFVKGIEGEVTKPDLLTLRVAGNADRGRVRQFIDDARAKNVSAYVLAAPALNSYAVELLKDSSTPIVTEDWIYGSTYSNKVLFSVDQDIPSALMKVVETMGRAADNEIRIPWDLVSATGHE